MRPAAFAILSMTAAALGAYGQPSLAGLYLDHYNCYVAVGPLQPQLAILKDQFDTAAGSVEFIRDLRMTLFCNPVQKTHNGAVTYPLHPADHLAMYRIPPEPMVPRTVVVQNQFGTQTLVTRRAEILAVPSGKTPISPTTTVQLPPVPPASSLDHFKCYDASGPGINTVVALKDQFLNYRTTLMEPILFCNPVQKTVVAVSNPNGVATASFATTTISNPNGHLTCYTEATAPFQSVVIYNNQFVLPGTLPTVAIGNAEILCVPSLVQGWSIVTSIGTSP